MSPYYFKTIFTLCLEDIPSFIKIGGAVSEKNGDNGQTFLVLYIWWYIKIMSTSFLQHECTETFNLKESTKGRQPFHTCSCLLLILLVQRIKGLRKRTEGHSCGRLRHENINRSGTISSRSLWHCSRFPKFPLSIGWRHIPPKSNQISLKRLRSSRMENVGYLVATSYL